MKNRVITVLLIFCLVMTLTSCNKSKGDDTDTTTDAPLSYTVSAADGVKYNVVEGKDKSGKQIYNISGGATLSVAGDRKAFLAQKLVSFADLNFDGNLDLVLVKSGYDTSGKTPRLAVYLFDAENEKFNLTKADICDYELLRDTKIILVKQSKFLSAGTDTVCTFNDDGTLKTLRTLEFGVDKDKKQFIKATDYSDEGTLLLYNSKTAKDKYDAKDLNLVLTVGLDGKTTTISDALNSVYALAGSKKSGVAVDCEGLYKKDGVFYYRMRVDKSEVTAAYYSVNSQTGETSILKSSSQLI